MREAASHIGFVETPVNHTPFGKWYGLDGYAWCDMFVSYCAARAGESKAVGKFALTRAHAQWFANQSRLVTTPQPGDLVFYAWGSNKTRSGINHIGIIERYYKGDSRPLQTIEGNTSTGTSIEARRNGGGVLRMRRSLYSVVCYARPNYTPEAKPKINKRVLQWQRLLRFSSRDCDGIFGPFTYQHSRWITTAAKYKNGTLSGTRRSTIQAIQRIVGVKADGIFGSRSRAATTAWIKKAQNFLGVRADGIWGPRTEHAYQVFLSQARA
jgi:hypothetical protein